jgi:hypothetical protein
MWRSILLLLALSMTTACRPATAPQLVHHEVEIGVDDRPFVCRGGDHGSKAKLKKQKTKRKPKWKSERMGRKMRARRAEMRRDQDVAAGPPPMVKSSLLVERIAPQAQVFANAQQFWAARVKLRADRARLGDVVLALSDALGVSIVAAPPVVNRRVTMAMPNASMKEVVRALRLSLNVAAHYHSRTLRIETHRWAARRDHASRKRRRTHEARKRHAKLGGRHSGGLETLVVPVPEGVAPRQLAVSYCRTIASRRGSASVLGEVVMVRDGKRHVAAFADALSAVNVSLASGKPRHVTPAAPAPAAKKLSPVSKSPRSPFVGEATAKSKH